jgi:glycerol kinase
MNSDAGARARRLRVDGGASRNDFLMQFQADILGIPIERPAAVETTALGAAQLAGVGAGLWRTRSEVPGEVAATTFRPKITRAQRERHVAAWRAAVSLLLRPGATPRSSRSSKR